MATSVASAADSELKSYAPAAASPGKKQRQGKTDKGKSKSSEKKSAALRVLKPGDKCQSEEERNETLLYAQRTVWVNLQRIIVAAIRQSLNQNYTAAKFLCDFAGVYAASDSNEQAAPTAANAASSANSMQTFLADVASTDGQ